MSEFQERMSDNDSDNSMHTEYLEEGLDFHDIEEDENQVQKGSENHCDKSNGSRPAFQPSKVYTINKTNPQRFGNQELGSSSEFPVNKFNNNSSS